MDTLSALSTLCEGKRSVTSGSPSQRTDNADFDVIFAVTLNKS